MAIVNENTVYEVVMIPLDLKVVDATIRTQSAKSAITSRFENLNTVHPVDRKKSSFLRSCARRSRAE
jgi:hypothetical protein